MLFIAALLALFQPNPTPAADVAVEVGRFEPEDFPELIRLERRMPEAEMVRRVEAMLADGRCQIAGATQARFNIVVPFAVQMQANGAADTVVVQETGCESLERLVGQIVVAQLERGDFRPQHTAGERWYVSELGFALGVQDQATTIAQAEPDRVICRAATLELGSRIRQQRDCRTAAQWQAFDADRNQLRRDVQNAGRCGGSFGAAACGPQ